MTIPSNRYEDNKNLLEFLRVAIESYPDMRFSQILVAFDFVKQVEREDKTYWEDEFYLESKDLCERVINSYSKTEI